MKIYAKSPVKTREKMKSQEKKIQLKVMKNNQFHTDKQAKTFLDATHEK